MVDAPLQFQVHAVLAFLLILVWPFTRLVHVFSAPIGFYLTRPYIVYRSAGDGPGGRPDRASASPENVGLPHLEARLT